MTVLFFCTECGKPVLDCSEWQSFCSLTIKEEPPDKEELDLKSSCSCSLNPSTKVEFS